MRAGPRGDRADRALDALQPLRPAARARMHRMLALAHFHAEDYEASVAEAEAAVGSMT